MKRRFDPPLRLQPWKVVATFRPVEQLLHRIENDGAVEYSGNQIVAKEDNREGYYDVVEALRGVIQFFEIAATRYRLPIDVQPMVRFTNKLGSGALLFDADMLAVRSCISECKVQVLKLRQSQADDIINTVRISGELDKLGRAA